MSSAYSQHNLGSYTSHPQRTSNIYPSIPSAMVTGHGPAENFYTGNSAAPMEGYGYPQAKQEPYSQYRPSYASYDQGMVKNVSNPGPGPAPGYQGPPQSKYDPQRPQEYQMYPQSPSQRQDSQYFPDSQAQVYNQRSPSQPPLQTSTYPPIQVPTQPDLASSYYQNPNQAPNGTMNQQSQPPVTQGYSQSQPPPEQYQQPPTPLQPYAPQQAYQPQATPQQAPYSQQIPQPTMPSYNQDHFPSAPNHQPQPKLVEEALIEL